MLAGVLAYVNIKKNEISKNLITKVNTVLVGEIGVNGVDIEALWTYPNINIRLNDIEIFEADLAIREPSAEPVIVAPYLVARLDLKGLFSNTLEIQFVEIKDATVVIERTEKSEVTIGNTFMVAQVDTSSSDSVLFVLKIDSIHLVNTQVLLTDATLKDTLPIRINELSGNLSFEGDEVKGFADAKGCFEKLDLSQEWSLTNKPLAFKVDYSVAIEEEKVFAKSPELVLANKPFKFDFVFDYAKTSMFELNFGSLKEGIEISSAFNPDDTAVDEDLVYLKGLSHLSSNLKWQSNPRHSFLNNMTADINIYGSDIHVMGVDIEGYIDKYKRSQNFNLLDVGAVMFAGPAGLAVTKGSDYTVLLTKSKGDDSTVVNHFVSEWDLRNGRLSIDDLAMSTERSRIASIGFYDLNRDSIDFNILILDKQGCALANQSIYGYVNDVQTGKVKVVKTLLGPVTNFFRNIGIAKCDILYNGKVSHPEQGKKKKKKNKKSK